MNPVWASEIDDFPAAVTAHHFPNVRQMGDITKIKAEDLEPVDIICAGSPCQDLSVAGKREGLDGARSGLFRTAVDIVHALRNRTGRPRFFVWENVPGAFSSNKGMDFRAVLEEISQTSIPMPANNKWAEAGVVEWAGGSLAWRVLDAQYWGVPQRRKRIFLVADFGGFTAGEILFVEAGMCGDSETGEGKRENIASDAGAGVNPPSSSVMSTRGGQNCKQNGVYCISGNTIGREPKNGGNHLGVDKDVSFTLNTADRHAICTGYREGSFGQFVRDEKAGTTKASGGVLGGGAKL